MSKRKHDDGNDAAFIHRTLGELLNEVRNLGHQVTGVEDRVSAQVTAVEARVSRDLDVSAARLQAVEERVNSVEALADRVAGLTLAVRVVTGVVLGVATPLAVTVLTTWL